MNVFGGATRGMMDEGPRGPRGFRGRDSSMDDLATWLPQTIISNLQKNDESGSYFIKNPEKDLVRDDNKNITQWVTRSMQGDNLIAVKKPANELEEIHMAPNDEERYAMIFKNAQYRCHRSQFISGLIDSIGFACITFRTNSEDEQVLISTRGPSAGQSGVEIKISGATEITIQFHKVKEIVQHSSLKEWTTLFIEYNSDKKTAHFTYDVNGSIGSFTAPAEHGARLGFVLGSRWDGTKFLDGEIASVECYSNRHTVAPLPDTLKSMVIKNQEVSY